MNGVVEVESVAKESNDAATEDNATEATEGY